MLSYFTQDVFYLTLFILMEGLCVICSCMCVFIINGIYFNTVDCLVHCK